MASSAACRFSAAMTSALRICRYLRKLLFSDGKWPQSHGSNARPYLPLKGEGYEITQYRSEVTRPRTQGSGFAKEGGNEAISNFLEICHTGCRNGHYRSYPCARRLAATCMVLLCAVRRRDCRFDA